MCDVRSSITDITTCLPHDTDMLVTVQKGIFFFFASRLAAAMRSSVGLEAGIGEDDYESLGVLVVGGDGHVLLCDEPRKFGRRKRLRSWDV